MMSGFILTVLLVLSGNLLPNVTLSENVSCVLFCTKPKLLSV